MYKKIYLMSFDEIGDNYKKSNNNYYFMIYYDKERYPHQPRTYSSNLSKYFGTILKTDIEEYEVFTNLYHPNSENFIEVPMIKIYTCKDYDKEPGLYFYVYKKYTKNIDCLELMITKEEFSV